MATNFPTSLDSLTNPTATDTLDSPPHDTQHANANDAIEALQAKVGVNSSAVTSSHDYKIAQLEGLGDLTTYTPTWTNFTVGNATQDFAYCVVNDLMFIEGRVVLGSTSSMGSNPYFSIPSGYQITTPGFNAVGHVNIRDTGTAEYFGQVKSNGSGSTICLLKVANAGSTYGQMSPINANSPMTWTTSDELLLTATLSVTAV